MTEVLFERDDATWATIQRTVTLANGPETPPRPYEMEVRCGGAETGKCVNGKTPGRGQDHQECGGTGLAQGGPFIPNFPCGYCAFKAPCWGAIELVLTKEGKAPRWRVMEAS